MKLNTRRIKVSNESVQCWAFKTLVENQEIIWSMVYKCRNNIPSSYINIQNFLFDMGWSPHLDTSKKNYFYLDVKNSKFSHASPCESSHRVFSRCDPALYNILSFFTDKVRWPSSLTFYQLTGKGHHITILATSPYTGVDQKGTFKKIF